MQENFTKYAATDQRLLKPPAWSSVLELGTIYQMVLIARTCFSWQPPSVLTVPLALIARWRILVLGAGCLLQDELHGSWTLLTCMEHPYFVLSLTEEKPAATCPGREKMTGKRFLNINTHMEISTSAIASDRRGREVEAELSEALHVVEWAASRHGVDQHILLIVSLLVAPMTP